MKFIQNRGYNDNKEDLTSLKLYNEVKTNITYQLLMIDTDESMKERYDAIGDLAADVFGSTSLNKKEYNSPITEQDILLKHAEAMRSISNFIGYFFSSTSFRTNTDNDFDNVEFCKRLDKIKTHFKS